MSEDELLRKANRLEQQMYRHARDLEFEAAAKLRDEIERIRRVGLGLDDAAAG
jgi:excinuclease ABC subunit B